MGMKLRFIKSESRSVGYGNRQGHIKEAVYACPCGKGTVNYEVDDIVGYKNNDIYCNCSDCKDKYIFKRDGIAEEK